MTAATAKAKAHCQELQPGVQLLHHLLVLLLGVVASSPRRASNGLASGSTRDVAAQLAAGSESYASGSQREAADSHTEQPSPVADGLGIGHHANTSHIDQDCHATRLPSGKASLAGRPQHGPVGTWHVEGIKRIEGGRTLILRAEGRPSGPQLVKLSWHGGRQGSRSKGMGRLPVSAWFCLHRARGESLQLVYELLAEHCLILLDTWRVECQNTFAGCWLHLHGATVRFQVVQQGRSSRIGSGTHSPSRSPSMQPQAKTVCLLNMWASYAQIVLLRQNYIPKERLL